MEIRICVMLPGPRQKIETLELKLIEFESDKVERGELWRRERMSAGSRQEERDGKAKRSEGGS